jgi:hypothetical protein
MRPEFVVFFDSFSQFKPHSSYAVGNEITTRIELFAEGAVANLPKRTTFALINEKWRSKTAVGF